MNVNQIPLSSPHIDDADREAVLNVLSGRVLSIGPVVERFEQLMAERSQRRFAVAVSSGTAALHLIVRALGWKPGDEVITTPFSFVASTNCLLYEGVKPVFVDIDPVTRCIDPARIESAITSRTVGIVSVDVFGFPADWGRLAAIASRHGLAVITDSCESLGAQRKIDGEAVAAGKSGVAGAFAFYPNKQMTTGEGGAVVTDDPRVASLCRSMRNQGRDEGAGWLQHARLGFNYRLSEINSALGVSQLSRLDGILAQRDRAAMRYLDLLAPLRPALELPPTDDEATVSWFVFVVRLADHFSRQSRDELLGRLRAAGIGCSNYFSPIHLQPYVADALGCRPGDYPITERIADRTIALPFFTGLEEAEQLRVAGQLALEVDRLTGQLAGS